MNIIFSYIYITFFTFSLTNICKKKFEQLLPFTFIISALSLFLSQFIFKTFIVGYVVCLISSLEFLINELFINRTSIKKLKTKYLTKGFYAFSILYLLVIIYDFNRFFTHWDELSHWGKMVKEMFRLDSFYSVDSSNLLVHKDYPPMISLMQLFFTYLSGSFNEIYLIRILHLFEGSLIVSLIPFEHDKLKNNIYKSCFSVVFIFLLTLLFDTALVVNSIYTDYVMALLSAYMIIFIYKIRKINYKNLSALAILSVFLLLTKQASIAFYLLVLLTLVVKVLFKKENRNRKAIIKSVILMIIIPVVFYFIWSFYVKSLGIVGQFDLSKLKLGDFIGILKGTAGEEWQRTTIFNFGFAIMDKSIINSSIISLSFFQLFLIIEFIVFVRFLNKKDNRKPLIFLMILFLIGAVGYMALMLILYVFAFGIYEGPVLASFDRYMCTYILFCLYILFFVYITNNNVKLENIKKNVYLLFIIVILIVPTAYLKIRPDQMLIRNKDFDTYREIAKQIDSIVDTDDKVYIIDQNEDNGAVYKINYFSNKIITNNINYHFDTTSNDTIQYFYNNLNEGVLEYDYLYTYNIDSEFVEKYQFLCKNTIEGRTLYKIIKNNNTTELIKVS